ncbi:hypothetical protein OOT46_21230 [Aquabacterium sp. A7-Y]|uniref:glycosyl hydrolase n=1 Tax=Aquabacterium sp. A7-Y TaxID=1349605 RepID=UPI00223DFD59|nr:glycosyl hydrolase [Aquabacterium sp. A7-Y]MCW7540360.1 hypothetical protein [Aquabacterium sp. A7-Y]
MKPIASLALLVLPALVLTACGGGGGGGADASPSPAQSVTAPVTGQPVATTSSPSLQLTAMPASTTPLPTALAPLAGLTELQVAAAAPAVVAPLVVARSTFEEAFSSRAPGWTVNAYNGATWSAAKSNDAATGTGAQSFTLLGKGTGDATLYRPYLLKQGRVYEVRVKYKLPAGVKATLMLRHDVQPWDSLAQQTVVGTGAWQPLTLKAAFPYADQSGSFRVAHHELNTPILIDDFEMIESRPHLLAQAKGQPVSPLFSGMHVNKLGQHNSWPALGVEVLRLHDTGTTWRLLQPEDAPIDWVNNGSARRLDYYVFNSARFGSELVYTFSGTPTWAASDPTLSGVAGPDGAVSGLKDVEAFRRFVRELGQRYKGRIRYWEVWNEANYNGFWRGGTRQLAEMTAIAAEELKAIDPANKIIAANISWIGQHWLENYLDDGAAQHVDILSYHYYGSADAEVAASFQYNMRSLAERHGLGHLPIWNTEGDSTCTAGAVVCPGLDPQVEHARLNARALLTMAAAGVGNYNYYTMEGRLPEKALLSNEDWVTMTPVGLAYAEVSRWLRGATLQDGWCEAAYCAVLLQGRGWAVWPLRDNVNATLPFVPAAARLLDGQRVTLSGSNRFLLQGPVLFELPGAAAF